MATTAYACKTAIFNGLTSAFSSDTTVEVSYGFPRRDPAKRWVMVGRIIWTDTAWKTFPVSAGRAREEEYTIAVIANVQINGGTEAEVDEVLDGMSDAIEGFLRTNTTLGVTGVWSVEYCPDKAQAYPVADSTYEGQLSATVKIKARI